MNIESVWNFAKNLPFVTERMPFDKDTLALEIGGKIFALLDLSGKWDFYNLKVDVDYGVSLREEHEGIRPAWHMNKKHWISVDYDARISQQMHQSLILHSYRQVLRTLPRKIRNTLAVLDIRATSEADLPIIRTTFDKAKSYMRLQGNTAQWSGKYPDDDAVREDMRRGWSYVVEHCGEVVGTFCLMSTPEPTYSQLPPEKIRLPYSTLHRVASNGKVAGVTEAAVKYALSQGWEAVCIDTHTDNRAMLRAIKALRMKKIGVVKLADATDRTVFMLQR